MGSLLQLLLVKLQFEDDASFRFFHGPTLYAYLHACAGTNRGQARFPHGTRFIPCETGRIGFERGQFYHFGLALTCGSTLTAEGWLEALQRGPRLKRSDQAPLANNVRLQEVEDLVGCQRLGRRASAVWLDERHLTAAARSLVGQTQLTVRFQSPLLILRTPVDSGEFYFDERVFEPHIFLARVQRAVGDWFPDLVPVGEPPRCELVSNGMVGAETVYHGTKPKRLSGALGEVVLSFSAPLDETWSRALLLAGVVGVGKNPDMGQGRFGVVGHPLWPSWPPPPSESWMARISEARNLSAAREAVAKAGKSPGVDDVDRDVFLDALTLRRANLQEALLTGTYRPPPLRGLLLRKPSGGVRALAIPTMEDRFVQRACFNVLAPALDELLEECSFGYRRGLSRENAVRRAQRAKDEGYTFALDADLHAFFDTVSWELLESRLRAYLGQDPKDPLIDLLMTWVKAPVHFADREIQRSAGLPQGAVVSPMLANLYLDPFDELVESLGVRLVRYADDFMIFCRSPEQVTEVRAKVVEELERLRLRLSDAKTEETSFERGFEFLGYLFCKSVCLQKRRSKDDATLVLDGPGTLDELRELTADEAKGWVGELLADLSPQADTTEPSDASTDAFAATRAFRGTVAPNAPERRSVYVVSNGLKLSGGHRGLRIYEGDKLTAEHAWSTISEIVVLGGHYLTASTFQQALKHRVPIALYSRGAKPLGMVLPERVRTPSPMTRTHWKWHLNEEHHTRPAVSLIEAKIHNQRLLTRYQPGDNTALRDKLHELGQAASRAQSIGRLRALEGQAARAYFAAFARWLPADVGFRGRSGQGAIDPVNAVLNLLYTNLFRLCWLAAINTGLDPYLGVLHVGRDRYAALAADLQEPFRFLCDRLVLELFHREILTAKDFDHPSKGPGFLRLQTPALKRVLTEWEARLEAKVKVDNSTLTYRSHIVAQTRRFAELVTGQRADLNAFRLKW